MCDDDGSLNWHGNSPHITTRHFTNTVILYMWLCKSLYHCYVTLPDMVVFYMWLYILFYWHGLALYVTTYHSNDTATLYVWQYIWFYWHSHTLYTTLLTQAYSVCDYIYITLPFVHTIILYMWLCNLRYWHGHALRVTMYNSIISLYRHGHILYVIVYYTLPCLTRKLSICDCISYSMDTVMLYMWLTEYYSTDTDTYYTRLISTDTVILCTWR